MNTLCFDMTKTIKKEELQVAAELIRAGELVAFPTETVYGLGANALDPEAVKKIFLAKKRPGDNPLIVHIWDASQLSLVTEEIPFLAKKLMEEFWPGPLTILFRRSKNICDEVTAGLDTVAVRMPRHPLAKALLKEAGVPIAAPSANVSGKPSPTRAWHVKEDMDGRIACIIDGGAAEGGLESTVVDVLEEPLVLRPGGVTLEMLRKIEPSFSLDPALHENVQKAKSPGQKYKHYAPNAEVEVYVLEGDALIETIKNRIEKLEKEKVGLMVCSEHVSAFLGYQVMDMGQKSNPEIASEKLFEGFRTFDKMGVELILVEGFSDTHMGLALMNRLKKASKGKIYTK